MTSATGSKRWRRAGTTGFTLVEILLTVALMGLLAGLCIAGAGMLASSSAAKSADIFWQSVGEARTRAVNTEMPVELSIAEAGLSFRIKSDGTTRELALPENTKVRFVPADDTGPEYSVAGSISGNLSVIRFYRDGTCDAFRVEIQTAASVAVTIPVDPWTCAAVLARPSATGP